MSSRGSAGALLSHARMLDGGPLVRLRLARPGDEPAIAELMAELGIELHELHLTRLVGADPRRRAVICAVALVDGQERVLGFGSIALSRAAREPDTLVTDRLRAPGLHDVLREALREHAAARAA